MFEILIDSHDACECRVAWEIVARAAQKGRLAQWFVPKDGYNPEKDRKNLRLDQALSRICRCECYVCKSLTEYILQDLKAANVELTFFPLAEK